MTKKKRMTDEEVRARARRNPFHAPTAAESVRRRNQQTERMIAEAMGETPKKRKRK